MKELKTLKDLPGILKDGKVYANSDKLKEEAIKQIKEGLNRNKNFFKLFCEFHNITEEDLI